MNGEVVLQLVTALNTLLQFARGQRRVIVTSVA